MLITHAWLVVVKRSRRKNGVRNRGSGGWTNRTGRAYYAREDERIIKNAGIPHCGRDFHDVKGTESIHTTWIPREVRPEAFKRSTERDRSRIGLPVRMSARRAPQTRYVPAMLLSDRISSRLVSPDIRCTKANSAAREARTTSHEPQSRAPALRIGFLVYLGICVRDPR